MTVVTASVTQELSCWHSPILKGLSALPIAGELVHWMADIHLEKEECAHLYQPARRIEVINSQNDYTKISIMRISLTVALSLAAMVAFAILLGTPVAPLVACGVVTIGLGAGVIYVLIKIFEANLRMLTALKAGA